ncbi:uncharacterized protein LOC123699897 [Colias croceus]|uniref:uncharacterized protein LOC123699897 n=1 Tax=Colias crocea TaxID=72248 RepID=UPI001E27E4E1|nr:uncharacterized protein LOC123699897 [Colias croceus]
MGKSDIFKDQERRRGRPAGKNRVPLSVEERRARNAQYERERRVETSEAMAQLAQALGCEDTISNADILATAVQELQRAAGRDPSDDIMELRRCNAKLMQQIEDIEKRLTTWEERAEVRSKKSGGIKKKDKIKNKKVANAISISEEIKQEATEAEHPIANEPSPTEASACNDSQIIKSEPMQLTEAEPFQLDSIAAECPVNDWGIDDLIAEYL